MTRVQGDEAACMIRDFECKNDIEPRAFILGITGEELSIKFKRSYSYEQCGINAFIGKPFSVKELEKTIIDIYDDSKM